MRNGIKSTFGADLRNRNIIHQQQFTGISDSHVQKVVLKRFTSFGFKEPAKGRGVHRSEGRNGFKIYLLCIMLIKVSQDFINSGAFPDGLCLEI